MTSNPRLLDGIRVVEFCQVAAGPFCGMLLADYGAAVVKIEPPEGDTLRQWPPITDGYSENFASLNRGKRSLALNLKDPVQRARARALCLEADVVIENNRPGAMQRLGLGYGFEELGDSGIPLFFRLRGIGQILPVGHGFPCERVHKVFHRLRLIHRSSSLI